MTGASALFGAIGSGVAATSGGAEFGATATAGSSLPTEIARATIAELASALARTIAGNL
jgi:hypothetical protein